MVPEIARKTEQHIINLPEFEEKFLSVIWALGLPTDWVLVCVDERRKVFKNIEDSLELLSEDRKWKSLYVSKFLAAISSWLFDAALNYLWNETINDLREKVKMYNVKYFYDSLSISESKRKQLNDESDLVKLTDDELIQWCKNIELITSIGYKELDHIRYMRNWVSAAHPNNSELSAMKLLSYLETCLKEVISISTPKVAVEINKLLRDIKNTEKLDFSVSIEYLKDLPEKQIWNLINGLFWIYITEGIEQFTVDNINNFLEKFKEFIAHDIKIDLGLRYAWFKINNFEYEEEQSRKFIKVIWSESYIPDQLLWAEIKEALDNLLTAHRWTNNFYSEPVFARQLFSLIWELKQVPREIERDLIFWIVEVYLTNWLWYAWNADPIYEKILSRFNERMSLVVLTSFMKEEISIKLSNTICSDRFVKLLYIIEEKIIDTQVKDFIQFLAKRWKFDTLRWDPDIKKRIKDLKILLR